MAQAVGFEPTSGRFGVCYVTITPDLYLIYEQTIGFHTYINLSSPGRSMNIKLHLSNLIINH